MGIYLKAAVFTLGRAVAFHIVLPAWYILIKLEEYLL